MSTQRQKSPTEVVTGLVRFSYAHLFEAVAVNDGDEKKYSVSIIIPKSDTAQIDKIKAAVKAAQEAGKSSKWGGRLPPKLKDPLRDGDIDKPEDAAYADAYFITCTSKTKPGIIDLNKRAIESSEELYSGCYGRVSLNFYAYDAKGNKGVAAGLNNVQKVKDGEPLAGRSRAEDDFDDDFAMSGDAFGDDDDLLG